MKTRTTGEARAMVLRAMEDVMSGRLSAEKSMAVSAGMKVINDSMNVEIKAAKMTLEAEKAGKDFGRIMRMGRRPIGVDETSLIESVE